MNDSTLRAFLLGRLPADEAERLEEQALQDQEFFETLCSVEDDLFDESARNALSAAERDRFLERYGGRHDRLAFAKALRGRSAGVRVLPFSRGRWVAGLGAAAALVLAVGTTMLIPGRTPEAPVASMPPAVQPGSSRVAPAVALTVTLGTSRVVGRPVAVTLKSPAGGLDLRVRLDPAEQFELYALELRSTADRVVWRADDVRAAMEHGELVVRAAVPADALAAGAYELAVRGVRGAARAEDVGFVTLEVRKTP